MAITDTTMNVIYQAMQGLQARQKVNADNIANLQTPGFRAGTVDFESSLKNAISTGDPSLASIHTARSNGPFGNSAPNFTNLPPVLRYNTGPSSVTTQRSIWPSLSKSPGAI